MAIRLLDAPGIEIHEIDKSQYTPSMTGTRCFVMGFANKGECYVPQTFTSKNAWQNYYGEPDNEAERYFYNACSEVINQNGVLYCSRLPYDNESLDKMVAYKYKVGGNATKSVMSFHDVITSEKVLSATKNSDPAKETAIKWGLSEYLNDDNLKSFIKEAKKIYDSSPSSFNEVSGDRFFLSLFEAEKLGEFLQPFMAESSLSADFNEDIASEGLSGYYDESIADGFLSVALSSTETSADTGLTPAQIMYKRFYEDHLTLGELEADKDGDLSDVYAAAEPMLSGESFSYHAIKDSDETVAKYIEIDYTAKPYLADLTAIDEYRTGESMPANNTFVIADKTCGTLGKIVEDTRKGSQRELIGIFPVVTTVANALYAQGMIQVSGSEVKNYESINGAVTQEGLGLTASDVVKQFSNDKNETWETDGLWDTVCSEANTLFPAIAMNAENTHFDTEHFKKIGVVVYKAYLDPAEGNKVNFIPVEAFVGSLGKDDVNPNTGASTFIDKIVNSNSEYIYFFSNCFNTDATKKIYRDECDFLAVKPGDGGMLGFYEEQTAENISLSNSILKGMDKCFDKVSNIDERDIDVVCDAGISNIAQYLKTIFGTDAKRPYDLNITDDIGNPLIKMWKCKSADDVKMWKQVVQKFDNFCKNVRKDCMFACDGPRPLVLQGQKKIIRESKPSNTIDADILPYLKWITGLNTNYGAGYMDWFQVADDYTGDYFWCPPSIKAMGVYINTDLNFQYWDAPAGLNRGIVQALDVAFSPTNQQAGPIYTKSWNYAIDFPNDGIVLWGQRTLQTKPSALDRVNVRRLCLRLERQVYRVGRYFLFEGNTAYTRQRLIDLLTPVFQQAKIGGGLYDYKIICDETNNTPTTIDNNELHLSIGIKPVKSIEFIICNFVILSTGGSWDEM